MDRNYIETAIANDGLIFYREQYNKFIHGSDEMVNGLAYFPVKPSKAPEGKYYFQIHKDFIHSKEYKFLAADIGEEWINNVINNKLNGKYPIEPDK